MIISENIKQLRKERNWTQARLAMEAHVSQQAISFIERGRNEPSAEMIRALAAAFGVNPSRILGENQNLDEFREEWMDFNSLSPKARQLFGIFEQLNDAGQDFLIAQAESILSQPVFRKDGAARLAE